MSDDRHTSVVETQGYPGPNLALSMQHLLDRWQPAVIGDVFAATAQNSEVKPAEVEERLLESLARQKGPVGALFKRAGVGGPGMLDRLALTAAAASLQDDDYVQSTRAKVTAEREK